MTVDTVHGIDSASACRLLPTTTGIGELPLQSRELHGCYRLAGGREALIETRSWRVRIVPRGSHGSVGAGCRECEKVMLLLHPDLVFHHKVDEGVAIDQCDRLSVLDPCGLSGLMAESARSDNEANVVEA